MNLKWFYYIWKTGNARMIKTNDGKKTNENYFIEVGIIENKLIKIQISTNLLRFYFITFIFVLCVNQL